MTSKLGILPRIKLQIFSVLALCALLGAPHSLAQQARDSSQIAINGAPEIPAARHAREAGSVEGRVTFQGEIPRNPIPDDAGWQEDLLHVDGTTRGLGYVVVHIEADGPSAKEAPGAPQAANPAPRKPVVVDQVENIFTPPVVAVRSGEIVTFLNSDQANHNVRTMTSDAANQFNVFTGIGGSYKHQFASSGGDRPIRLSCDIHPWMRAWVYVFDHPRFAVTDKEGAFRIENIPPGEHRLILRQPDIRYSEERVVTVKAGETTRINVEIKSERPPAN